MDKEEWCKLLWLQKPHKSRPKHKFKVTYQVTDASVHDSQALENLLDENDANQNLYADSAYTGQQQEKTIKDMKMEGKVCEKGYRNHPLTDAQKETNREKSKIRSLVEHVFGFMENSMNRMTLEVIGQKWVEGMIGLINLTYNLFRKVQISSL